MPQVQEKKPNYTKKIALNTLMQIIGKMLTTGISLVLIAALTRYLGVEGYGDYTTIFTYVAFFSIFADLGFFWIMVREISKPDAKVTKIANNIITLRVFLGLLVYLIGFFIAWFIPNYSHIIWLGIGVCSIGWFLLSLNSTYVGIFQAKHHMEKAVISEIVGRIVILFLVWFFIHKDYGLITIIAAYTVGNVANFLLSIVLGWKLLPLKLSFDFAIWKEMFWESLPMGFVLILGVIVFRIDTIMLSIIKGSTDVGIYGPPYKILEILVLIPTIFMGNVFPVIARYHVENKEKLSHIIQKSFDFLTMAVFPVMMATFILATPTIKFISGEEFLRASTLPEIFGHIANSALTLQFLIFSEGIMFFSILFNNTAVAIGQQRRLIIPYLLSVSANIILNLIIIPKYSYIGTSVSTFITELLLLIFTARIVYQYIQPLKINKSMIPKSLLASVIMGVFLIYIVSSFHVILQAFLAMIVYFTIIYLIKGFTKEDIELVLKKNY